MSQIKSFRYKLHKVAVNTSPCLVPLVILNRSVFILMCNPLFTKDGKIKHDLNIALNWNTILKQSNSPISNSWTHQLTRAVWELNIVSPLRETMGRTKKGSSSLHYLLITAFAFFHIALCHIFAANSFGSFKFLYAKAHVR